MEGAEHLEAGGWDLGTTTAQDGVLDAEDMARFLVVLKPRDLMSFHDLIGAMDTLVDQLGAQVEHRTPAHLSAMLRDTGDSMPLQLFADVQSKAEGPVLELVLMSREPMGRGAPHTLQRFVNLVDVAADTMPGLDLVFRSDRDGPLPDRG